MTISKRIAASSVIAAILATSAAPAIAIPTTHSADITSHDGAVLEQATDYRRYRRHRHRRHRVDVGDIITGIGILAGIAIIADAASKENRSERRERQRDYPDRRDTRHSGNDLGAAVSACTDAAERAAGDGSQVDGIRSANRDGPGWRVSGDLSSSRGFDCGVNNGVVDFIQLDDRPAV
ncbi:MAG: hypothetical protein V3V15_10950 [Sphingorhabdus sp.]